MNILIIEPLSRKLFLKLRDKLMSNGHTVIQDSDRRSVRDLLKSRPIDVIILDADFVESNNYLHWFQILGSLRSESSKIFSVTETEGETSKELLSFTQLCAELKKQGAIK